MGKITLTNIAEELAAASGMSKEAILETGVSIQVPMFVNEGELIRVATRTGEYMERVKG